MEKRGNVVTSMLSMAFWIAVAITFGISMLIFTENSKDNSSFYLEKDAIDIAYSMNALPLASGSLEIKHSFNPEFSYKVKDGRVTVSKSESAYKKFVEDSYLTYNIKKKEGYLVLENEQKS